jgi:hypothetical protein
VKLRKEISLGVFFLSSVMCQAGTYTNLGVTTTRPLADTYLNITGSGTYGPGTSTLSISGKWDLFDQTMGFAASQRVVHKWKAKWTPSYPGEPRPESVFAKFEVNRTHSGSLMIDPASAPGMWNGLFGGIGYGIPGETDSAINEGGTFMHEGPDEWPYDTGLKHTFGPITKNITYVKFFFYVDSNGEVIGDAEIVVDQVFNGLIETSSDGRAMSFDCSGVLTDSFVLKEIAGQAV